MELELENKGIKKEDEYFMPYVKHNEVKSYAILRVGRRFKTLKQIKDFTNYTDRTIENPNADESLKEENRIIYGSENIYKDVKQYLKDVKVFKNSVVGREILLTCSPQFFKGLSNTDFEKWIDMNKNWLVETFGENLRYVVLHMDQTSPHLHGLIIPKMWSERSNCYTLQAYKYFSGRKLLTDMQDNYAEYMQKTFSTLSRGIKGSKSRHIPMKLLHQINSEATEETNIETLQAKAANQEYLKKKVNYMDKTIKSINHFKNLETEKLKEENELLKKELEEIKKSVNALMLDKKEESNQSQTNEKTVKRGFSGKRYNKPIE